MLQFQGFKPEALQRIANTLGYQGDMQNFEQFLQNNPDKQASMQQYTQTAMNMVKGGAVERKNYQAGGATIGQESVDRLYQPTLPTGGAVAPVGTEIVGQQMIDPASGQVAGTISTDAAQASVTTADMPQKLTAATMKPSGVFEKSVQALEGTSMTYEQAVRKQAQRDLKTPAEQQLINLALSMGPGNTATIGGAQAAQGEVDPRAQVDAAQGALSPEAKAIAATASPDTIQEVEATQRTVTNEEIAEAAGQAEEAVKTEIAEATKPESIRIAQTSVSQQEIPKPAQIRESEIAQAEAITMSGLTTDATATAAKLQQFNVDDGTLAEFKEGKIEAQDTVQGQLASLMQSFDDGTPAWAAGAMRAANASMAARGLGGSSMAGAAIVQAAMESALPIAQQDAQAFQQMKLSNLNRQQQVALANAAAAQGVELANFNAEQQVALQNSQNAFALQGQNLSNMQQTVLANAQIKSALQGQNLNNRQQANIVTAARFAEVNNLNLSNRQQGIMQDSSNNLTVDMTNLNNRQQSYVANAQLEAALQGKVIDNQQQTAITNAAKFSDANNLSFTAEQQAQLHNSELMKTVGLAELNTKQAATLQNAAQLASMDMANLNNRQQAAVQNAQNFLQVDMANLSNEQQTVMFEAQAIQQALLSDQAAENAARQFNASSQNQTDQFFTNLQTQVAQFNAAQMSAQSQFNAGESNVINRFNAELINQRDQFNAQNQLVIDQSNVQWRRQVATADTEAVNRANELNATNLVDMSNTAYNNLWQYYSDTMEFAYLSAENERDRSNSIARQMLANDSSADIQELRNDYQSSAAMGSLVTTLLTSDLSKGIFGGIFG